MTTDPRTFGALATRLTEALGRGRAALDPHGAHLPDGVLGELDAMLAEFARRRVRIAIYGEVKAGKSTLLNAIAGAVLSPTAFDPLTSIPVRVTYGASTAWRLGARRLDSVAALEQVMRDGGQRASEVVVETDLDLLQLGGQVDLLDTPGVGSVTPLDTVTAEAVRALDAVVMVVRYPALFTEYTRRLVDGLDRNIGKLFVVWNLDAACAELAASERQRHADTLRANIGAAHELFLVDARNGLRAREAGDMESATVSGLATFTAALRTFVSSAGREVAALREAAKRAHQQFETAQAVLSTRHAALDRALAAARARLQSVQARADEESAAARARLVEFENDVLRIGQERANASAKIAADLQRELRTARRQWARGGDLAALTAAIDTLIERHADATAVSARTAHDALQAAASAFGTTAPITPRSRMVLIVGEISPEQRSQRATSGRGQWLRRSLWHRWYLPGLAALDRTGIAADVSEQTAWWDAAAQASHAAAQATLASRLAEITRRARADQDAIKAETTFATNEAEFAQLSEHLPVVAAQAVALAEIGEAARALVPRPGST